MQELYTLKYIFGSLVKKTKNNMDYRSPSPSHILLILIKQNCFYA